MSTFVGKSQVIEAVQWTGMNTDEITEFGGGRVRFDTTAPVVPIVKDDPVFPDGTGVSDGDWVVSVPGDLQLQAGVDGVQGWVDVPVGHWLVSPPGNRNDIWPVEPDYFKNKYDEQVEVVLGERYEDSISGYRGVATSQSEFLSGNKRVCLERPDTNGKPEECWFDQIRVHKSGDQSLPPGYACG